MALYRGDQINHNVPGDYLSYGKTFYGESQYYYIRANSFGIYALVHSAFLGDWHGRFFLDYWNGYGWTNVYFVYMQDTSSNDELAVKINANNLNISGCVGYIKSSPDIHNLWRARFVREKWGTANGVTARVYIGSIGNISNDLYNEKYYHKKIYSNGTIGKDKCGLLDSGSSTTPDTTVLSYFASNKGTPIYKDYYMYVANQLTY